MGGVEKQTALLARWLASEQYPVFLITWDEGGPQHEIIEGVHVFKTCGPEAGLRGVRFFHPKWTGLLRTLRLADADVYYQNGSECVTGQVAMWCGVRKRGFIFSAASDADCSTSLQAMRRPQERVLYRYGLRQAKRRIVQTESQQRALLRNFNVCSDIIPMPCEEGEGSAPSLRLSDAEPRILWVGRVCRVKRPELFVALAGRSREWAFDLVGPIQSDAVGARVVASAAACANLRLHGPKSRESLSRFYHAAACLCCTSEYEGFPNTFLEAWSHGLPVVSTFDPDDLIARRGLGIVVDGLPEMKSAIQTLLGSPGLYQELSENAYRYYRENHTVEAVMPRFARVFHEVAAQVGRQPAQD